MVDIHTHILPGIDDGSKSWEMTEQMCRMAIADGVTHMVASPHCNDVWRYDRPRFEGMLGDLSDAARGEITFSLGCDFHFSYDNVQDALQNPRRYTIGDTRLPAGGVQRLRAAARRESKPRGPATVGMHPIITHPERTLTTAARPEAVLEMARQGCVVQVTAGSFTGFWGSRSKRWRSGCSNTMLFTPSPATHMIPSNAHRLCRKRARRLRQLQGREVADALVTENPSAIVEGQTVPYRHRCASSGSGVAAAAGAADLAHVLAIHGNDAGTNLRLRQAGPFGVRMRRHRRGHAMVQSAAQAGSRVCRPSRAISAARCADCLPCCSAWRSRSLRRIGQTSMKRLIL